jgi:hypothetical protein
MPYSYADLRSVLAGIECDQTGRNPWVNCTAGDEYEKGTQLVFNFPEPVLWVARLLPFRLTVASGDQIGPYVVMIFLLAFGFVFSGSSYWQALYFCALIISPPVLLGIERANYDLILFVLIFLAIRYLDRISNSAAYGVICFAGMLKLFPIAAILGIVKKTMASRTLFWIAVAFEAAFLGFSIKNLAMVANLTPQTSYQSFGHLVLLLTLSQAFASLAWLRQMELPILLIFGVFTGYFAFRNREYWLRLTNSGDRKMRRLFLAGAAIYSVCFALHTSYNYRLIFLAFTVPYLLSVASDGKAERRTAAWILSTLLLVFWLSVNDNRLAISLLQETLTWLLFFFFASCCIAFALEAVFGLAPVESPLPFPAILP